MQGKKNQAISYNYNPYNYNPCRKEFLDSICDISIQNYLEEYDILDMEKNLDRKYFNWMGMNGKRKKTSLPNKKFWFFSKLNIFYSAYKMNPWILPIKFFFFPLSREDELVLETKKYVSSVSSVDVDLKPRSYYSKYYFKRSNSKYRTDSFDV